MKKNKKIVIAILIILAICLCSFFIYNIFFKEEIRSVSLNMEVYSDKSLYDFTSDFECILKDNIQFNTDTVDNYQIITHCKDSENNRFKYIVHVNVSDTTIPTIILNDYYTVTKGYKKNLIDTIISFDNYDDEPKRQIIGDYDLDVVGNYNLTYKITDSSNNSYSKDFTLKVIEPVKNSDNNSVSSYIDFSDALKNYKTDNSSLGIDVSKWQGVIDFKKVKESGCEFVIIRIGHQDGRNGQYIIDPYFEENYKNALKNNLNVGVYFYSYADSNEEAKKQAEWIVKTLNGRKLDLPIVYDWESFSSFNSYNLSSHSFNEVANTFFNIIVENNYEPMLYGSKNYLEKIWDTDIPYKIWLAHYTNKTNYEGNYYIWQMCSDGKIDGINGYVDIDILYK